VIQASPFCNIDCRYCYLPDRASTRLIERRTLAKIFERLFESAYLGEAVEMVWHAGEPLTVPIAFYEDAVDLLAQLNRNNVCVKQHIQTNAMLISQEWCDFFKSHRFQIGVSIDGPRWLHDAQRITRQGRGTFDSRSDQLRSSTESTQYSLIRPASIRSPTASTMPLFS
jgi:uncharacterized protein